MIIDVILSADPDRGTLLIWGVGQAGLEALLHGVTCLASGSAPAYVLSPQPAIQGVTLEAKVTRADTGLRRIAADRYEWCLSRTEWDNVAGLIEPFRHDSAGFQFLSENDRWTVILAPTGRY
ncbi:MAG TPA: hypothetical protein VD886_01525 [Herpetosiphonaceae bacterium]|nr:hypothetical protein [Herpetosiphonaceae bacterium]